LKAGGKLTRFNGEAPRLRSAALEWALAEKK